MNDVENGGVDIGTTNVGTREGVVSQVEVPGTRSFGR